MPSDLAKEWQDMLEAGDNKSAAWLWKEANILHMECELGTTIILESRNYNTMAYFIPLTFDMGEWSHMEEVTESNGLLKEAITKWKWAKVPEWHNPNQMVGHMIITFTDPDSANRAIINWLVICNKMYWYPNASGSQSDASDAKATTT